jgi:hypothetical protein
MPSPPQSGTDLLLAELTPATPASAAGTSARVLAAVTSAPASDPMPITSALAPAAPTEAAESTLMLVDAHVEADADIKLEVRVILSVVLTD